MRDRVISSIAIYMIVLFLFGPGFKPQPNSMIFFIGPGFDSQARLPVSGQCDSWPISKTENLKKYKNYLLVLASRYTAQKRVKNGKIGKKGLK